MNLSDEDRARLDELAQKRDRGEISSEEYQRLCWATLAEKNRKPKDPAAASAHNAIRAVSELMSEAADNDPSLPPMYVKPASLIELTTCNPQRTQTRQPAVRRSPTGLTPNISMTQLFRMRRSRTPSGHAMLFPRRGWSLITMLLLLVASIMGTIVAADWLFAPPHKEPPPSDPTEATSDFIKPLFGNMAVAQCHDRCRSVTSGEGRGACEQGCRYLAFSNYGRRITLKGKLDPRSDAEEIHSRCVKGHIEAQPYLEPEKWDGDVRTIISVLQSVPRARVTNYEQAQKLADALVRASRALLLPAESKDAEFTKGLIRAACLRTNVVFTEMALMKAAQADDEFSHKFFASMFDALQPRAAATENDLLAHPRVRELQGKQ